MKKQTKRYQLHCGDCLDVLPTLEPGSIDTVIADIPYGTTACKWDSIIPFEPMWAGIKHVIKPRAAVVLFGSQPFTSALVMSNVAWFKYSWVWKKDKATGHLNATVQPMLDYEDIVVFGHAAIIYNPQISRKPVENIRPISRRAPSQNYGKYHEAAERLIPLNMSFPKRIIETPTTNHGERGLHPTQKPVALMEYLIRTYTNKGDTVLDFTMGSGSTGVAAVKNGRDFIGIELDHDYFKIAETRIKNAAGDFVLTEKEKQTGQMLLFENIPHENSV